MIFATAFAVFFLDRITKALAVNFLSAGEPLKILPGVFQLTLVFNTGTAFGLFKGLNPFFIAFSILIICAILFFIRKNGVRDIYVSLALGLILGGALGNLFDRVNFGSVIDFFDFRVWPVFNIADSCLTAGILILAWKILGKKCTRSC